ncbi:MULTISPECIES: amino acid ABC transporter ATP-binding protein [unclassified Pigmentiphaga]|uniref:amino acid ABC transporter ATP-binding protein n=1 Tax=unclassified Pigmentiphaga TaxID=2626614 RepID=UPI00104E19DE|nr:amino acid ABC transporter ATP-binding protein [Pigmentiphaga sp. D-2]
MALLTVRDLKMAYDGRTVLNGIDLDLEEGELKVVMGPSGCGKSTLLRCLNRLVTPTSGQIIFRGEDVTRPDTDVRALRQRIGFVFQNFALYRHLTALENVTLGLRKLRGMATAAANERAMHELGRMNLAEHAQKYPSQLSGGQKQRVAIARALAMDPAVLFFDEPTSALDPVMSREIINVINQLRRDKVSMLCVTHDLALARAVQGRVLFLDQGQILAEGEASELFGDHADPRIRAFFN